MVSNPYTKNRKHNKVSGLLLAVLMILTPALTLGTASAEGSDSAGTHDDTHGYDNNTADHDSEPGLGFERITCENYVEPVVLELLSTDSTTLVTNTANYANEIAAHPAWNANIGDAKWVWNNSNGYGYVGIVDFYHKLNIPLNAYQLTGDILIAADNSYEAHLNGQLIGFDVTEYNFKASGVDHWSLDSALTTGHNVLDFQVDNWHVIGGLMYGAVVQYCLYEDPIFGDDNNTGGDNGGGDNGGGDNNDTGGDNTNVSCQFTMTVSPTSLYAGDTLTMTWIMTGAVSSQVYIAVFSGWNPAFYHHNSIEPNTGVFSITLPNTLDASMNYHAYIESADNGQRTTVCWQYAAFDVEEVVEPGPCNNTFHTVIVSDTLTLTGGSASQIVPQNAAWVNPPMGSSWIWDGSYGHNYVDFQRGFTIPLTAYDIEGSLLITADNAYNASMNGQYIGSDWDEYNFQSVDAYSLTSALQAGYNSLDVGVYNMHMVGGLAFAMNLTWCDDGITVDPPGWDVPEDDLRVHYADRAYQIRGYQVDYDRVLDAEDPLAEFYQILEELELDTEEEDDFPMSEWEDEEQEDEEEFPMGEWEPSDDEDEGDDEFPITEWMPTDCDAGLLAGAYVMNEDGSGILEGRVLDLDGEIIGYITADIHENGLVVGEGGDLDGTTTVEWTAVGQDGRFVGLWQMLDGEDSGVIAGTFDEGTFAGFFMSEGCSIIHPDYVLGDELVGISPVPTPIPGGDSLVSAPHYPDWSGDKFDDVEDKEDNESEGKMVLPDISKEEQLVVAGAGTGTTLSLLGLALRRRLLGSPL